MISQYKTFSSEYKIYFSDTDIGGVCYYANYLKFAEHARSDALEEAGFPELQWAKKENTGFIVKNVNLDLIKPLTLNDKIRVLTTIKKIGRTSFTLIQDVHNIGMNYKAASMEIVLVSIETKSLKPVPIPEKLIDSLTV